jgi:hypothetical protein
MESNMFLLEEKWGEIKGSLFALGSNLIKEHETDKESVIQSILYESFLLVEKKYLQFIIIDKNIDPSNYMSEFFLVSLEKDNINIVSEGKAELAKKVGKGILGAIGKGRKYINSGKIARRINLSGAGVKVFNGAEAVKSELKKAVQDPKLAAEKFMVHGSSQVIATVVLPGTPFVNIKVFNNISDMYKYFETELGKQARQVRIITSKEKAKELFTHPGKTATSVASKTKEKIGNVKKFIGANKGESIAHAVTQAVIPHPLLIYPKYIGVKTVSTYTRKYGKRAPIMLAKDANKMAVYGASMAKKGATNAVKIASADSIPDGLLKATDLNRGDIVNFYNMGVDQARKNKPAYVSQSFISGLMDKAA